MNQDMLDRLIEELRPLAEKLGQGAEFLWEVAYRQTVIDGSMGLIGALIALAVIITFIVLAKKNIDNINNDDDVYYEKDRRLDDIFNTKLAATIGSIFVSLFMLSWGYQGVARILNPGFYAIQNMFKALGIG